MRTAAAGGATAAAAPALSWWPAHASRGEADKSRARDSVSTPAQTAYRPADAIAGLLSALAIVCSSLGLVYRPVRLIPFAILIALIAAGMSGRNSRLAAIALGYSGACFVAGTFLAIITNHPIF
jgi:hypothetical protein